MTVRCRGVRATIEWGELGRYQPFGCTSLCGHHPTSPALGYVPITISQILSERQPYRYLLITVVVSYPFTGARSICSPRLDKYCKCVRTPGQKISSQSPPNRDSDLHVVLESGWCYARLTNSLTPGFETSQSHRYWDRLFLSLGNSRTMVPHIVL